ncbi:helix-hairpin-helix domain-containing protein [Bifidobacterium sp. ESL0732]|uniref:ComEA family DNA-binding protein n=1 Tax=Bifidobacterium sp. ESL0732 TaxID=2983222 RepID=UPI0023F91089|nr:helix-hairpin-helix domain-containing protein [Bifidobacterium sp. ESL0732]WEV63318.1 helix-hairpin-helix domain-containing protein [Bifidobacterium sp. ESL0732]
MGIHFNGITHDESQFLTKRLYSSAMLQAEPPENEPHGLRQDLDEHLLRVGLPPLPPIDTWLIEPEDKSENTSDSKLKKQSESIDHTLEVDDFDSVIDGSVSEALQADSSVKSAAKQQTIPRLVFKPTQAVVVILVLVVALCASLTMLVTQTINYNKQQAEASSISTTATRGGSTVKGSGPTQGNALKSGGAAGSASTSVGVGGQNTGTVGTSTSADPSAESESSGAQSGASNSGSNLINLNTADSTQLQQIKGVGPVMAQKIIDYRTSIGRFTSVDQLLKVSGIGQKTLEKIRGQVTV